MLKYKTHFRPCFQNKQIKKVRFFMFNNENRWMLYEASVSKGCIHKVSEIWSNIIWAKCDMKLHVNAMQPEKVDQSTQLTISSQLVDHFELTWYTSWPKETLITDTFSYWKLVLSAPPHPPNKETVKKDFFQDHHILPKLKSFLARLHVQVGPT